MDDLDDPLAGVGPVIFSRSSAFAHLLRARSDCAEILAQIVAKQPDPLGYHAASVALDTAWRTRATEAVERVRRARAVMRGEEQP